MYEYGIEWGGRNGGEKDRQKVKETNSFQNGKTSTLRIVAPPLFFSLHLSLSLFFLLCSLTLLYYYFFFTLWPLADGGGFRDAETCCAHPNYHLGENRKTLPTTTATAANKLFYMCYRVFVFDSGEKKWPRLMVNTGDVCRKKDRMRSLVRLGQKTNEKDRRQYNSLPTRMYVCIYIYVYAFFSSL